MIFIENFLTVVLAIDKDVAQNIIEKVQLMIDNVPGWLMPKQTMKNKHSIGFKNKSKIIAMARGGKKGRSYSPKLLIFDECVVGDTKIKIRNKITGEIRKINIRDLYDAEYK